MTVRPTDPLLLIDALDEAHHYAQKTSLEGWTPFEVFIPRPIIRGVWRVMRPGVQVLVIEALTCAGTPPPSPIRRPTGLRVLSGSYRATLEEPMKEGTLGLGYTVTDRTVRELLTVPGTRYGVNPIERFIALVVRLAPFPNAGPPYFLHQVSRPKPEHIAALRTTALRLLAD